MAGRRTDSRAAIGDRFIGTLKIRRSDLLQQVQELALGGIGTAEGFGRPGLGPKGGRVD